MQAIIDLGTNTFHLMIASLEGKEIIVHHKLQVPVKIGSGGIHKQLIEKDAMQRAIDALAEFRRIIDKYSVDSVKAYATAAIREASNGGELIHEAQHKLGIEIKTITGDMEAQIIAKGVMASLPDMQQTYLITDIGGGSVECIIVANNDMVWHRSFKAGASLLIHRFDISDPIDDNIVDNIERYFEKTFADLIEVCQQYKPKFLVGSAGSFETLLDVAACDMQKQICSVSPNASTIAFKDAMQVINWLIQTTETQRKQLKGLVPFRIEMIVVSMLLTRWLLCRNNIKQIICSAYSLKEGMLLSND